MSSRIETLLRGIIDNTGQASAAPGSRIEAMLNEIIAGGGGRFAIHICEEGEYNTSTGIPTIANPEENTFYLVPLDFGTDSYEEYIYINGAWERFGGAAQTSTQQDDWEWVQSVVRAGSASRHFEIGDQLITTYKGANTDYQMPWDIVDIAPVVNTRGETVPGLWLQSHFTIGNSATPISVFDASEAIYYVSGSEGISAGSTVYFTFGSNIGNSGNANEGDVASFTIPSGVIVNPSGDDSNTGMRFAIASTSSQYYWNADATARSSWRAYGYDFSNSSNNFGPVAIGNDTSGINLGTLDSGTLNRASGGSNRWDTSAMRLWLSGAWNAGSWWQPRTFFDLPPSSAETLDGFAKNLSSDFLNVVPFVKVTTLTSSGTSTVTNDRFFLPSLEQIYYTPMSNGAVSEGSAWPYWREVFGTSEPVSSSSKGVHYMLSNRTTLSPQLTRTCSQSNESLIYGINSNGSISTYKSAAAYQIAPCCVIC